MYRFVENMTRKPIGGTQLSELSKVKEYKVTGYMVSIPKLIAFLCTRTQNYKFKFKRIPVIISKIKNMETFL